MHTYQFITCLALTAVLSACATPETKRATPAPIFTPNQVAQAMPSTDTQPVTTAVTAKPMVADNPVLRLPRTAAKWADLPDWESTDLKGSYTAFLQSCTAIGQQPAWTTACQQAQSLQQANNAQLKAFFEMQFTPYEVRNEDGSSTGTITGYYEPLLQGSLTPSAQYPHPVYGVPDDLITVDLGDNQPSIKGQRVRGRLEGKRLVPYYSRAELQQRNYAGLENKILAYSADPIDIFFLQIQGSGQIALPDGKRLRLGYADQNGHAYKSIGKYLIDKGELTLQQASMQGIKAWAKANPQRLNELLNANPSYVFFKVLNNADGGPLGALGVPLTDGYSMAIDPKFTPLGAPLFVSTTEPNSTQALNRLMIAQDTGGAIRGAVRGDFYWGFGDEAGAKAGKMKQQGKLWVLIPKGVE